MSSADGQDYRDLARSLLGLLEVARRTLTDQVLVALHAGERPPMLRHAHFDEVLAEMNAEHQSLTRSLLGGDAAPGDARPLGALRRPRR